MVKYELPRLVLEYIVVESFEELYRGCNDIELREIINKEVKLFINNHIKYVGYIDEKESLETLTNSVFKELYRRYDLLFYHDIQFTDKLLMEGVEFTTNKEIPYRIETINDKTSSVLIRNLYTNEHVNSKLLMLPMLYNNKSEKVYLPIGLEILYKSNEFIVK